MARTDPFATRLSLLTGKGGVGKTTVAAALAMEAARRGRPALVVELGHRASLSALFGPAIGHEPREVAPSVFATSIQLDEALRDYVRDHVPVARLARRISASRSLARFFEAAPAVSEVVTVHRIERLLDGPWGHVFVDLDATGHALMFLELPRVFEELVSEGPLRRLLDGFGALLSDPLRTALHLVTLPGQLPVQETLELYGRLVREHPRVRLGTLFANRVPVPVLGSAERDAASLDEAHAAHRSHGAESGHRADLGLLARELERGARARAQLARLAAAVRLPMVELPERSGAMDLGALAALGVAAGGAP